MQRGRREEEDVGENNEDMVGGEGGIKFPKNTGPGDGPRVCRDGGGDEGRCEWDTPVGVSNGNSDREDRGLDGGGNDVSEKGGSGEGSGESGEGG